MTSPNPLVAPVVDAPVSPWEGVWLAEDVSTIVAGVRSRSWVDVSIGGVSAGLDTLAFAVDPVGSVLQYGASWLMEHVRPLTEALDWLAGDPGQITAGAQTWRNVAAALHANTDDALRSVRWDTSEWEGTAGDAYRDWTSNQQNAITALATAADGMATIVEEAGFLIATVREMVRDAIAIVVSRLLDYAAEELFSLGALTGLVLNQATALCSAWGDRIARWMRKLLGSLRRLNGLADKLHEAMEAIARLLRRMGGRGGHSGGLTSPSGKPDPGRKPRGPRTRAHPTKKKDLGLRRENETADLLVQLGYDVEQNPPPNQFGKHPDYRVEGEYFDCYSPTTNDLDTIRDEVSGKVKEKQADRIVLNLEDCPRSMTEIRDVLERKPVADLQEILVVKDGRLIRFYPFS
jgi:uncharacterized protein YukE